MPAHPQGTRPAAPPAKGTVTGLIQFLARPHMHTIIYHVGAVSDRPQRFLEILQATGVPKNTLTNRLRELVAAGLFVRTEHDENPPRVEYAPTERLMELVPMFQHMHRWADRHSVDGA